jgi:hypothetical protein
MRVPPAAPWRPSAAQCALPAENRPLLPWHGRLDCLTARGRHAAGTARPPRTGHCITAAFIALAVDQGLRRLLRGHSFALTYAPSRDRAGPPVLTEVRVYGAAPAEGRTARLEATGPPRPELSAAAMAEAAADQERAERMEGVATLAQPRDETAATALAQVLATEPDAPVRAKAVRVLGHVGGEPALADLERGAPAGHPDLREGGRRGGRHRHRRGYGPRSGPRGAPPGGPDPGDAGHPGGGRTLGVAAADPSALVRQAVPAARPPAP